MYDLRFALGVCVIVAIFVVSLANPLTAAERPSKEAKQYWALVDDLMLKNDQGNAIAVLRFQCPIKVLQGDPKKPKVSITGWIDARDSGNYKYKVNGKTFNSITPFDIHEKNKWSSQRFAKTIKGGQYAFSKGIKAKYGHEYFKVSLEGYIDAQFITHHYKETEIPGIITGRIVIKGRPMADVEVKPFGTQRIVRSGKDGTFTIKDVPPGQRSPRFRLPGGEWKMFLFGGPKGFLGPDSTNDWGDLEIEK